MIHNQKPTHLSTFLVLSTASEKQKWEVLPTGQQGENSKRAFKIMPERLYACYSSSVPYYNKTHKIDLGPKVHYWNAKKTNTTLFQDDVTILKEKEKEEKTKRNKNEDDNPSLHSQCSIKC